MYLKSVSHKDSLDEFENVRERFALFCHSTQNFSSMSQISPLTLSKKFEAPHGYALLSTPTVPEGKVFFKS